MFVTESAQLPAGVQSCGEGKDVLIEERIPHLHRGVHRDSVPLGREKVPGQSNASCDPDATVQWMPAPRTLQIESQLCPRMSLLQHFPHRRGIEAKLGKPEQSVGINPRVRATDRFLHAASYLRWVLGHMIEPEIRASRRVAQPQSGQ